MKDVGIELEAKVSQLFFLKINVLFQKVATCTTEEVESLSTRGNL